MTIYDQFGTPIDMKALKVEQAAAEVTGVRSVISGHPSAGLTPGRLAALLREAEEGDPVRYLELAEDMEEKDLHYRGVIGTRKLQVSQLDVTVLPAGDDAEDQKNAELVEEWIGRETLAEEFFDIMDAVGKGYSVQEIMWETSENQWMPARLEWRDPRWFRFDRFDGQTLRLIGAGGQEEDLAPYKFVVHTHKAKSGLSIRSGLARAAAWAYLFKNYDIKGWVAFAEVFGQPLRLGKYHPGATEVEKEALLRAVANISRDAAAIIPETMNLEFVKSEVRGSSDLFERLANFMDMQVSKAVLGQTTTTDAISGGHSVSKEHNKVREDIERSDAKQLSGAINRAIVRPLIDLNRGPQKRYPCIRIGRPEDVDVPRVVAGVKALVPLGLRVGQKQMRNLLGLWEPDKDEELLQPTAAPPLPPDGKAGTAATAAAIPAAPAVIPRDGLDDLADLAEEATRPAMDGMIDAIREVVNNASSMRDVADALAERYPDISAAGLVEVLREAQILAELEGRAELLDGG